MRRTVFVAALSAASLAIGMSAPVDADVFSSKNRRALFKSQKNLLDNRASKQYLSLIHI